jgi:hypothetical protein
MAFVDRDTAAGALLVKVAERKSLARHDRDDRATLS